MPLKMGAPRLLDPQRVQQLISEMEQNKVDWTYPQLAQILSKEIGIVITPAAVSNCARRNNIILPKIHGRKRPKPST
ncbi:hypothetical protein LC605_20795 [Nostoc sp. CHAB 5836]|nr:hypothetical protein [Nostoc sp. CHAB 5836]